MTRVKKGTIANKRRKNVLSLTKGYRFGRKNKERAAKEAIFHAGQHAFQHRRKKKRDFRGLWQTQISAAVAPHGFSYSRFIHALKQKNVGLNRKMLAELAKEHPDTFETVVSEAKK